MFVFYSIHYPRPEQEELGVQQMRQLDELMKKQPGILFVSDIFKDPEKGTLMGFTFWESQEAFQAKRSFCKEERRCTFSFFSGPVRPG